MPVVLQLTAAQQLQYARIADELNATGFETEPFGNRTIAVKAAPAGVGPAEIEKLLFEILEIARIASCAACRSTTSGATSRPPSPAARPSRSICGSIRRRWSGC